MKRIVTDCSAVMPQHMHHRSDHSIVITTVEVGKIYKMSSGTRHLARKLDYCKLQETETRDRYQRRLDEKLRVFRGAREQHLSAAECWYRSIKQALEEAAAEILPPAPQRVGGNIKYTSDRVLSELSTQQRKLTTKIYGRSRKSRESRSTIKKRRSTIFKALRRRQTELQELRLSQLATKLEEHSESHKVWEWLRQIKKTQYSKLVIRLEDGTEVKRDEDKVDILTRHYRNVFVAANSEPVASIEDDVFPFDGRVSTEEVVRAVATLRNQRAVGPDGIPGELVKYGGPVLAQQLALFYSHIMEQSETVLELKQGYL
jgi:hypothetical protein